MATSFIRIAVFTIACMGLMVAPYAVSAQTVVRIAYPTFPPFHWVREDGRMTGFFYDIITEALERRMGLSVVWTAYPWIRCQENLRAGKDDAILTVPTADRAEFTVTHKDPFYEKPLNVFTYVGHPRMEEIKKIKEISDLKKGPFSVVTYSGNGWHEEHVRSIGIKTYTASYLENVWKMLAERRGDVVIEWPPGAWPDIRRAGVSQSIVDTKNTISTMPFHLLLRKDFPTISVLDDFNKTINIMKKDGTIDAILYKYH